MSEVWIIGNGGHARVVNDVLKFQKKFLVAGFISDDPDSPPIESDLRHIGPINLDTVRQYGVQRAVIAIGDNNIRVLIARKLNDVVEWVTAIHPSAIASPTARVGRGVLLSAGSIVQPGVRLGDHVILNTGASVDHDSVIGDYAHIAPGVHLAGNVMVGQETLVGIGACVIPGIKIGRGAVIGAGSSVIRDVPDGSRVAGVPAKAIR